MCCTLQPAKLTNTVLYAATAVHEGRDVHVMGYQNRAENRSHGPNAMLLPIPSRGVMGPDNMLDTTSAKHALRDYAKAIRPPPSRSLSFGPTGRAAASPVQVFDRGSFTVVLADSPTDIPGAIERIPPNKRPTINEEIFAAYEGLYPGWKMALCAWDGTLDTEPLLWWYEPLDGSSLFLPALDAHDGQPPRPTETVMVDHAVIVGSVARPQGVEVQFRDRIAPHLAPFLAPRVVGREFKDRPYMNGDFTCPVSNLTVGGIVRTSPPSHGRRR